MDNFQVDGAVPLRPADVMRIADGLENRILERINNLTNELRQRVDRVPQQEEKKVEEPRVDPENFQVFNWGGANGCCYLRRIPSWKRSRILYRTNKIGQRRAHDIASLAPNDSMKLFDDAYDELLRHLYGDR